MTTASEQENSGSTLPVDASDRTLMAGAAHGDAACALALIDRYAPAIWNLAWRTTGRAAVAEEATRTVLASALGDLAAGTPVAGQRWIIDLARRLYLRLLAAATGAEDRSARVRIAPRDWAADRLGIDPASPGGGRRVSQKLRQRLWRAWSHLGMRERFVLALCQAAPVSAPELAEVLGTSEHEARRARDEAKLMLLGGLSRAAERGRRRGETGGEGGETR